MRDVLRVLQRAELVLRIGAEIREYIVELGVDGRLVELQLLELVGDVPDDRDLVMRDYLIGEPGELALLQQALDSLTMEQLTDLTTIATALRVPGGPDSDSPVQPRGYRLLAKVPRLDTQVIEALVERFGSLAKLMRASLDDLDEVEGIDATRARAIKDGLSKLAETSILDRYT